MPKPRLILAGPLTKRLRRLRKGTRRARYRRVPVYATSALDLQLSAFLGPLA